MRDHERAMLIYGRLAEISERKQQEQGRDKFLVLTGVEALRAGWLDVAERCRELVLSHNARHMLSRYESFAEALRDADFQPLVRRLERMCPVETGESLLLGQTGSCEIALADKETPGSHLMNLFRERT